MAKPTLTAAVAAIVFCTVARADVPEVAVDIAPVHSLVAQVMGDLGEPSLILPPGASPHGYALRPSEAQALVRADIVVWVGEDLAPWLDGAIGKLAGEAEVMELLALSETRVLPYRENAVFELAEAHDDTHDHSGAEGNGTDEHHDDDHEGHAHDGSDPHAWLDPGNAAVWIEAIAAELARADPENAGVYSANAAVALERLEQQKAEISARLAPVRGMPFVVFHDAYQYFEVAFDVPARGAISLSDATDPGAARVAEIRDLVRDSGIECVAAEPQFNPALIATVAGGADVRATTLDPIGATLRPGPAFYGNLLSELADSLLACR